MPHTPGPWKAKNDPVARANGEVADFYSITGPDSSHVSYVTDTPYRTGDLGDDARLMAAAPDLLETLIALERWFDTDPEILAAMSVEESDDHDRQLAKIRAAIAKAKGE